MAYLSLPSSFREKLVAWTALTALLGLICLCVLPHFIIPSKVTLITDGQPFMGDPEAPLEIVLIEDFRCHNCQKFNIEVLPSLMRRYVETGEARLVIVPVSIMEGSTALANAALAVHQLEPDKFFLYLKELWRNRLPTDSELLLRSAARIGVQKIGALQDCLNSQCQRLLLERNLFMAKAVMGRQFGTPALYVNGVPVSTRSLKAAVRRIEQIKARLAQEER
jgi:protein-disulfide isomerase